MNILADAVAGFVALGDGTVLLMLAVGVVLGVIVGIIPGIGGVIALTLALPFTFDMDPLAALVLMVALSSVVATSDTIPAILFGVPGTVGCAATVLDGYPMAKRGEAGRALGAAFAASCFGGIFGAVVLLVFIPVLRPLILSIGSPEMLAFCIFGLSLAAVLSGNQPMKGVAAASIGLVLAFVGLDPQMASERWTFGSLYLWDGLSVAVVALGFFALPELADIAIKRTAIAAGASGREAGRGQRAGLLDVVRHPWLVIRCSAIGAGLGAIPGIGAAVIDWVAYGHAAKTEKGAAESFGNGDVRGVIASESSNNAKTGGSLIPTIAFGVPGSPVMALLIGAFLVFGIVPGPSMLGSNLDITMSLVWTIVLANILAAAICWSGANQLGRIATVRPGLLVPLVMAAVYLGALQASNRWGDLVVLVGAGLVGWVMKQFGWPRPPLILGFVLGALIERYLFISVGRYGWEWLLHPIVIAVLALSAWTFLGPALVRLVRERGPRAPRGRLDAGRIGAPAVWFALAVAAFFTAVLVSTAGMAWQAALAPVVVGIVGLVAASVAIFGELRVRPSAHALGAEAAVAGPADLDADYGDVARREVWRRAAVYALWTGGFVALAMTIGVLPALVVHTFLYLRLGWGESWLGSAVVTAAVVAVVWVVFQMILYTPWPAALVGDVFPALRDQYRLF